MEFVNKSLEFISDKIDKLKDEEKRNAMMEETKKNINHVIDESKKQIEKVKNNETVKASVEKTKEVSAAAYNKIKSVYKEIAESEKVKDAIDDISEGATKVVEKTKEVVKAKGPVVASNLKKASKTTVDAVIKALDKLSKKLDEEPTEEKNDTEA